jgi:hypothetical protein
LHRACRRDLFLRHPHHLIGDAVGLLLEGVVRRADGELRLRARDMEEVAHRGPREGGLQR